MGSISNEIREKQKNQILKAIESRKSVLTEKGVDEKGAKKDPVLRALEAKKRQAIRRLDAIQARDELVKKAAEKVAAEKKGAKAQPKGKGAQKGAAKAQGQPKKKAKKK